MTIELKQAGAKPVRCRSQAGTPRLPGAIWDRLSAANGGRPPARRQKLLACRDDLIGHLASLDERLQSETDAERFTRRQLSAALVASPLKVASDRDPTLALALMACRVTSQTARGLRAAVASLEAELAAINTLLSQETPS